MLVTADNEVVMHSNAHRFRGFYNLKREGVSAPEGVGSPEG